MRESSLQVVSPRPWSGRERLGQCPGERAGTWSWFLLPCALQLSHPWGVGTWQVVGPEGTAWSVRPLWGEGWPPHSLPASSCLCSRPVSFPETPYTASPAGADKVPPYRQPSGSFSTPGSATYARYKPSPERSDSLHLLKESGEIWGSFFCRKRTYPPSLFAILWGF